MHACINVCRHACMRGTYVRLYECMNESTHIRAHATAASTNTPPQAAPYRPAPHRPGTAAVQCRDHWVWRTINVAQAALVPMDTIRQHWVFHNSDRRPSNNYTQRIQFFGARLRRPWIGDRGRSGAKMSYRDEREPKAGLLGTDNQEQRPRLPIRPAGRSLAPN